MQQGASEQTNRTACLEFDERLVLFASGELNAEDLAEVNAHLPQCEGCTASLAREYELIELMRSNQAEPDAALLASCRANLVDALDQSEEKSWVVRVLGGWVPPGLLTPRPAFSAALLLVIGFSVGLFGPKLLKQPATKANSNAALLSASNDANVDSPEANSQSADPSAMTPLNKIDMRSAQVASLNVVRSGPTEPPQVQMELNARQPMTLRGDVNNPDVKYALINVLGNNQRFDPDMRLDAVDLLRERNDDPDVRAALCQAVHSDHNAAVRLKALEAVSSSAGPQESVRQTLLDALVGDHNPGVRVEAMNTLRDMAAKGEMDSDPAVLAVLRDRMEKDPSVYIRLQSAAALRDLAPAQKF
jgi:hypothetical protein